ncbi:hypothetical protein [Streptomyces triticirhizae]|uniref:Uncharacterized protein n=1 Tax=Streptomyces triticirhizae TaxID=2483353 RepID=A0A3M2LVT6_9ACTN|nr:hypothetical protein [Streptomyces triticirhizae]RMI41226.1 hypothetical protein EBN88_11430 [Streptomyces triticirhizae]
MIRDLYNVRAQPPEGGTTPLTEEEERRVRAVFLHDLGNVIAERGWVRFPAYSPEERRRLVDVAHRLSAHWGRRVFVEAEDQCALRLYLAGHGPQPATPPLP